MPPTFQNGKADMEHFLSDAKKVAKGATIAESGIDPKWIEAYTKVARRCRDDPELGISRYPYETGPSVSNFSGGYFEHVAWPLRKGLEKNSSMRAIMEYESHYINSIGYWLSFHEALMDLRVEAVKTGADEEAETMDVWACISVRYALRVVGMRREFYKMAAKDPAYARMVMPTLQNRNEVSAVDELTEALDQLDSHNMTQLMKAVATLKASNITKRSKSQGSYADGN